MDAKLKLLVVDDSEDDSILLVRELRRGGYDPLVTERVETSAGMSAALERQAWDVVTVDYAMPQFNGLEALRLLQDRGLDIPCIIVSGAIGEETAVAAMKAGAHDYIMKSNLVRLVPAIERELREVEVRRNRRRAEEALRESEQRLELALSGANLGLWDWNVPTGAMVSNDRLSEMLGYEAGELEPHVRTWESRLHPQDKPRVWELLDAHFCGKTPFFQAEYRLRHKNGNWEWVLSRAKVVARDETGAPLRVSGTHLDISDLKLAEETVRNNEKRFRALIEKSRDGIALISREGKIVYQKSAAIRFFGQPEEELNVQRVFSMMHPGDMRSVKKLYKKLLQETGTSVEGQCRYRGEDGDWLWLEAVGTNLLDDPSVQAIVVNYRDISERKQAEAVLRQAHEELELRVTERTADLKKANRLLRAEIRERQQMEVALRESEERFKAFMRNSPTAAFIKDSKGRYVYGNEHLELFLGKKISEIVGKSDFQLFSKKIAVQLRKEDRSVLRTGKPLEVTQQLPFSQDSFWMIFKFPIYDAKGRQYLAGVAVDTTERRRLEKEILEISDREKQRFGQDLHDGLCQHLTGIKFKSTLLENKLKQKALRETRDAQAISELLHQAIHHARSLAQGLNPVELEAYGLMFALQQLGVHMEKMFDCRCICEFKKPVLIHDNIVAVHLYRIAQEALANAIRHGRAKHVWITLSASKDGLVLAVKDDGVGFREKPRKKSGMGLHIMHYRARMIAATLEIRKAGGGGTVVQCSLQPPSNGHQKRQVE